MKCFKMAKSTILCFLLFIPFFQPQYFKLSPVVDNIYRYLTYAVLIYAVAYIIWHKKVPNSNLIIIASLELWILFSTIIQKGNTMPAVNNAVSLIGLASIVFIYSKKTEKLIKCLLLHFEICIYVNIITLIVFQNGIFWAKSDVYTTGGAIYFLGWNHIFIVWELPALMITWIYKNMNGNKWRCYILTATIVLSVFMFDTSSTGKIGVVIFATLCLVPYVKKIVTPFVGIVVSALLVLLIIFARSYGFLQPIIVGMLNKDMTFTGRLLIWDNAIKAIISKPILGHGLLPQKEITSILGIGAATHCHSQVLQILFIGGVVALALYVALYILDIIKCSHLWKYKSSQICLFTIIAYTIIGISEQFEYTLMYLILIIPFYLREICGVELLNGIKYKNRGITNE